MGNAAPDSKLEKSMQPDSYLISGRILFRPDQAILNFGDPAQTIKLQQPASRCLQLLISRDYELVSQHDLMVCGWGEKRAKTVTVNALYQTMHHLRQAFSRAGCEDVFYSVPRQGAALSRAHTVVASKSATSRLVKENDKLKITKFKLEMNILYSSLTLLSSLLMALSMRYYFFTIESNVFESYKEIQFQQCKVNVSDQTIKHSEIESLLRDASLDCQKEQSIWLTIRPGNLRNSLVVCPDRRSMKTAMSKCYSVMIMDTGVSYAHP